ncbi:hypothetical protein RKD19_000306 [Streptomyces canus]
MSSESEWFAARPSRNARAQSAGTQDVAHLVRDHVDERAVRFHLGEIGGVEPHHALRRQERTELR